MPNLDAGGQPVAQVIFNCHRNGDTTLTVVLARGARNLPVIDGAIELLSLIGDNIEMAGGDDGDEGGGEDAQPQTVQTKPSAPRPVNGEDGEIIVPLDDEPTPEGVPLQ